MSFVQFPGVGGTRRLYVARTPAEEVERDERVGRFEGVADELMQVESFAEHPAVRAGRRVDLAERQHSTPDLDTKVRNSLPLQVL